MKAKTIIALITGIIASVPLLWAQGGNILKDQSFASQILNKDVEYTIYLPPSHETNKDLPILYFLHYFGGNHNSSIGLMKMVDSMIINDDYPEMIIVTPNAKKTWYLDNADGSTNYASMFMKEFKPFIEKTYPATKEATQTIISGSSMGGFGAIRFTLLHPEQFGVCVGFQSAMDTKEQFISMPEEDYATYHESVHGIKKSKEERFTDFFIENNPLYIAESMSAETLNSVKWYIQCCDDDYHSLPNAELHILFFKKKVNHEFRVVDGEHGGPCVLCSLEEALDFMKTSLR